jgi:hypothetical protein
MPQYGPDDSSMRFMASVMDEPSGGLRFMKRRRVSRRDRNGDPLDGVVNLFNVAIVLAVGFLVAVLASLGMSGVLTGRNMTIVTNPGTDQMQVIVKEGDRFKKLDLSAAPQISGLGTLIGSFYQLADGSVVYVPAGELAPPGATPAPIPAPTPLPSATPAPAVKPSAAPTTLPSAPASPAPGVTVTPSPLLPPG